MAENRSNNHTRGGTRPPRGSTRPGATGGERPSGGPRRGPGSHGHGRFGPVQKAEDVRGTMFRLAGYLLRYKMPLVLTVVLVALASGLGVLGPFLMGRAIDFYIIEGDLAGLVGILGLMLAVNVVASGVRWISTFVMISASQQTVRDLRNDLFSKLQTLSLRYFDQHTHGELMSRLSNDVDNVSMVLTNAVTQLVSSALSVTGIATMMFIINWRLALVSLITIPLMLFLTQLVAKRTRQGYKEQQEFLGDINGIIEETVTGQQVVKAYAREDAEISRFAETNALLRAASVKAQIFGGLVGPMMNFVNNLSFAIVAGAGGWMAVEGLVTVGTIASFVNYARQFARPLNSIAGLYNQIQSALAGAERVFEVMDEAPDVQDGPDAIALTEVAGKVVFDDVCFEYEPDVPVLKNVSLYAKPGQTIALVGPTGAGKTTIVNLLTRFYDIQSGSVTLDGVDIRKIKTADLRRQLGIVLQDTFLFSATVMENIRYGRLDATDDEVIAAAQLANADQFIRYLPEAYQTQLTENGNNLSQGQRQLLAIARAILADPGILILDEATSSVDTRTEQNIQEAMLRLMEGRTSFVIAHRLSTIRDADAIIVIDAGKIVERGSHNDLMSARGFYYGLQKSQYRGEAMAMGEMMSGD